MRALGLQVFRAVVIATLLLLAGCGEQERETATVTKSERPAPNKTQRQKRRDPRGDVVDKPATRERTVERDQLDLLSVTLTRTRTPDELTTTFLTAAPPGPGMVQVLETYDRRQLVEGLIEIRYPRDGKVRAVARRPGGTFKSVPVKVVGREAVVRAPLNKYTRELVFKWRAYTVSSRPTAEIRDYVPTRMNDIEIFPREPI